MGNKNKTVSFRVKERKFSELKELADDEGLSLSKVFRDYVETFVAHGGDVESVPTHLVPDEGSDESFPATVRVPKSYVREHERLELEAEHLRENLSEYKRYASELRQQVEESEAEKEDVVYLEDVDVEAGTHLVVDE